MMRKVSAYSQSEGLFPHSFLYVVQHGMAVLIPSWGFGLHEPPQVRLIELKHPMCECMLDVAMDVRCGQDCIKHFHRRVVIHWHAEWQVGDDSRWVRCSDVVVL